MGELKADKFKTENRKLANLGSLRGCEAMICQRDVSGGEGHQLRMIEERGRETEQGPLVARHQ